MKPYTLNQTHFGVVSASCSESLRLQGYLVHKKPSPRRTLQ